MNDRNATPSADQRTESAGEELTRQTGGAGSRLVEIEGLIAELEAATAGSAALDARIHYVVRVARERSPDIGALVAGEGVAWPTVEAVLEELVPPYTTSLDAALDFEEPVFVLRSTKRRCWGAMQKTQAGEDVLVWAASEPIARRLAALQAWRTDLLRESRQRALAEVPLRPGADASDAVEENENKAWEVAF